MANKNIANEGKAHRFKKGNKIGKGRKVFKLPSLDEYVAKVLGEELQEGAGADNALEAILKKLRFKALSGDVKAATLLLDRGYGKAKQFIEQVNKNEVDLGGLTEEELLLIQKIQDKQNPDGADSSGSL